MRICLPNFFSCCFNHQEETSTVARAIWAHQQTPDLPQRPVALTIEDDTAIEDVAETERNSPDAESPLLPTGVKNLPHVPKTGPIITIEECKEQSTKIIQELQKVAPYPHQSSAARTQRETQEQELAKLEQQRASAVPNILLHPQTQLEEYRRLSERITPLKKNLEDAKEAWSRELVRMAINKDSIIYVARFSSDTASSQTSPIKKMHIPLVKQVQAASPMLGFCIAKRDLSEPASIYIAPNCEHVERVFKELLDRLEQLSQKVQKPLHITMGTSADIRAQAKLLRDEGYSPGKEQGDLRLWYKSSLQEQDNGGETSQHSPTP